MCKACDGGDSLPDSELPSNTSPDSNSSPKAESGKPSKTLQEERKSKGQCPLCGNYAPFGYVQCMECTERKRAYLENRTQCDKCSNCDNSPVSGKKMCVACADRRKAALRDSYRALKDEVYAAYGGYQCSHCDNADPDCLQLDHINDDGYEHRKKVGVGRNMFMHLKKEGFPPVMQILCANCNWKKKAIKKTEDDRKKAEGDDTCQT